MCKVRPERRCQCPGEFVYMLTSEATGTTRSMEDTLERVARGRLFTQWGTVRWRTVDNSVEEAPLSGCSLRRIEGETLPRAITAGAPLTMLLFGRALDSGPEWQLVVEEGMALTVPKAQVPEGSDGVWFHDCEAPLAGTMPETGVEVTEAEAAQREIRTPAMIAAGWRGPALAEGDSHSGLGIVPRKARSQPTPATPSRIAVGSEEALLQHVKPAYARSAFPVPRTEEITIATG